MVVADNCAIAVNSIFADYQSLDGSHLLLGAIFLLFKFMETFPVILTLQSVQPDFSGLI